MGPVSYSVSAPGSLFLLGEHAVLHNKKALVVSIDQRIKATLRLRSDEVIVIDSPLKKIETRLSNFTVEPGLEFVSRVILYFKERLKTGFELLITSDFSSTLGLGSSAAVTVAVFSVFDRCFENRGEKDFEFLGDNSRHEQLGYLFKQSRKIIREVQTVGSGADVAASVYGGLVLYQQEEPCVRKILQGIDLAPLPPLTVVYSGFKTPTPVVVKTVEEKRARYPKVFKALYDASDCAVEAAMSAIEKQDWLQLGEMFNLQQGVMNAFGVGLPKLNQLVDSLNAEPGIYGAKISGSGLGDCVIGIGCSEREDKLAVSPCLKGVCYE